MEPRGRNTEPPALFTYTVNYGDGSKEVIEVVYTEHVASYLQSEPASLAGAELAWVGPVEGSEQSASVWQMQWNNPHPEKVIQSIDLNYAEKADRWGAPVVLGITARVFRSDQRVMDSKQG